MKQPCRLCSLCAGLLSVFILVAIGTMAFDQSLAATAKVYRWVDKHGVVHYSDNPPPTANSVVLKVDAPPGLTNASAISALQHKRYLGARDHGQKSSQRNQPKQAKNSKRLAQRCKKLAKEIRTIASVRRLEVHEKGKTKYLSGQLLVNYRQRLKAAYQNKCAGLK